MNVPYQFDMLAILKKQLPNGYKRLKAIAAVNNGPDESVKQIFDTGYIPIHPETKMVVEISNMQRAESAGQYSGLGYGVAGIGYFPSRGSFQVNVVIASMGSWGRTFNYAIWPPLGTWISPVGIHHTTVLDAGTHSLTITSHEPNPPSWSGVTWYGEADSGDTYLPIFTFSFFAQHIPKGWPEDAATYSDPFNAHLHSLKFYEGSKLVRDFVPVERNSDGRVGMYDMVTRQFIDNIYPTNFTPIYL